MVELLDRSLQRRWLELGWLTARVHGFVGRPGVARLIRLLRGTSVGARSTAERLLIVKLRQAGVRGWEANVPIHDDHGHLIGVADVLFRALRLVIEVDGRAWHSSAERFQHDRDRQNRLVAAGWTVLRFTWLDLTTRPDYVIKTISPCANN